MQVSIDYRTIQMPRLMRNSASIDAMGPNDRVASEELWYSNDPLLTFFYIQICILSNTCLPFGNQTCQWLKFPNGGLDKKITDQWSIVHCHI